MADPITVTQAIRGGIQLFNIGSRLFGGGRDRQAEIQAASRRAAENAAILAPQIRAGALEELRKFGAQAAQSALPAAVLRELARKAGELLRKVPKPSPKKDPPETLPRPVEKLPAPVRTLPKGREGVIRRQEPQRPGARDVQEVGPPRPRDVVTRTPRRIGRPAPTVIGPPAPAPVPAPAGKSFFPGGAIALTAGALAGFAVSRELLSSDRRPRPTAARPPTVSTRPRADLGPGLGFGPRRPGGPLRGARRTREETPPSPAEFPPDPLTISAAQQRLFSAGSFRPTDPFLRNLLAQFSGTRAFTLAAAQTSFRKATTTRTRTKECIEVVRKRRRKGKCREGFFEEMPGKTRFTTWRVKECATGKTISEV